MIISSNEQFHKFKMNGLKLFTDDIFKHIEGNQIQRKFYKKLNNKNEKFQFK